MRLLAIPLLVLALAGCATPSPGDDDPDESMAPGCAELSLTLEQRKDDSADAFDIVASNDGDTTCTLSGYPAVEVLSPTGEPVGVAPEPPADATIEAVTLEPGVEAYALVEFDRGEADCETADTGGLRVTLPGSSDPVVLDQVRVLFCPAGDRVLAGSFRSEPLEGQDLQPDEMGY